MFLTRFNNINDGFPIYQVTMVCLVPFTMALAVTSTSPYNFFMIKLFNLDGGDAAISRYSGILSAIFSLCQCVGCIFWSYKANSIGRKPVILIGLLGAGVSQLIYGFSTNFYWALLSKIIGGLLNGNMAIVRTCLGELSRDQKYHSFAFSTIPLCWNLGSTFGPMIGSRLVKNFKDSTYRNDASERLKRLFDNNKVSINDYPFAPPNIVVAIIIMVSSVVIFLFFEEPMIEKHNDRDMGLIMGDYILKKTGIRTEVEMKHFPVESEMILLDDYEMPKDDDNEGSSEYQTGETSQQTFGGPFTVAVLGTIISHLIMMHHVLVYAQFLPIFLAGKTMVGKSKFPIHVKGGLGFDVIEIGHLYMVSGLCGIILVFIILPLLNKRFKVLTSYKMALLLFPLCYLTLPELFFTLSSHSDTLRLTTKTKILLYLNAIIKELATAISFSQIILLIHRTSIARHRAVINGYTLGASSLANILAPLIWGSLMATFERLNLATLFWWILAFVSFIGFLQSFTLRRL